ncbi:uncharacterized protein LOC122650678 [Telopea speciosissima]|uniref:uncharacterized protein LOC122650678 n=1 Tax=Telopea speciosissima TaxID=54955 RepID=UPI001CC8229F|nr:uncharacterized protein LOC122650678 [Telopea speciosissima]
MKCSEVKCNEVKCSGLKLVTVTFSGSMVTGVSSPVTHDPALPVAGQGGGARSGGVQSWAGLFRGGKVKEDAGDIPYYEPAVVNGKKVAQCMAEELVEESDRWEAALVGYVFGPRPSFTAMQKFVQDRWKHVGAVEVFGLENGMFVFDFQGCDLSRQILDEGPWTLGLRPLILCPWSPDVSLSRKVETELPLWVRFYGLNLQYWGDRTLGRIASVLGRPICADKRTVRHERLSFARVCVSIQASDGLPTTIYIAQDDGTLVEQAVQYDWIPPLCSTCKVYGHVDASCPISAIAKEQAGGVEVHDSSIVDDGWVRQNSHRRRGKRQVQIPPSAVAGSASPVTGAGVGDLTVRKPMEVKTPRGVAVRGGLVDNISKEVIGGKARHPQL